MKYTRNSIIADITVLVASSTLTFIVTITVDITVCIALSLICYYYYKYCCQFFILFWIFGKINIAMVAIKIKIIWVYIHSQ